jgi:predicted HTH transcriptional regulator
MTQEELIRLLNELCALPSETEWVEFKCNYVKPEEIGEYLSALANSASLHKKEAAYLVWGIEDTTNHVIGTDFKPRRDKVGNQELESWLALQLHPRIDFKIHEFMYERLPLVLFEVQPSRHTPVRFRETEFIRIGSYKKKLKDFPEKERSLWLQLSQTPFEKGLASRSMSSDQVLSLIDYPAYFDLMGQNLPANKSGILDRLRAEKIVTKKGTDRYNITNLGAILFAKNLADFDTLSRKSVRVIIYVGNNRIETIKEQVGTKGYAVGFEGLVDYINDQLPRNEQIGPALRKEVSMYPKIAVRELVANAIIHQDFASTGDSPMVEVFSDRIEITNPGTPLIDTLRFIDEPPQSRNETLAAFMRRLNICEERGSGIDKVIFQVEFFQLPPPEFLVTQKHTKAILFAPKELTKMDKKDKIRACYQHACLRYVSNDQMTNTSLRKRFSIEDKNYSVASRIIADTMNSGLVKPHDPESTSRKHAKYVPFWA